MFSLLFLSDFLANCHSDVVANLKRIWDNIPKGLLLNLLI